MSNAYERNMHTIRVPKDGSTWERDGRPVKVIQTIIQWEYTDDAGTRAGSTFHAATRTFHEDYLYPSNGFTPAKFVPETFVEYEDEDGDTVVLFEIQEDGSAFGKYNYFGNWHAETYTAEAIQKFTPKES